MNVSDNQPTNNIEAYKIWAPSDSTWAKWAKPVIFTNMPQVADLPLSIPAQSILDRLDSTIAVIVDLPGVSSVEEGLALAAIGYRPVPLYNGVFSPQNKEAAVPMADSVNGLAYGADVLKGIAISDNAPPAFLLDSNRASGFYTKSHDSFDNRWSIFYHDFPTSAQLLDAGIRQIVVFADRSMDDLLEVLYVYRQQGLEIFFTDGNPDHMMALSPAQWFHRILNFFRGVVHRPFVLAERYRGYTGACKSSNVYDKHGGYGGYGGYSKGYSGSGSGGYSKGYGGYSKGYSGSGYGGFGGGYGGRAG